MTSFISIPLKTTNEVDLLKPLKAYVESLNEISDDLRTETTEAIVELNKLRTRACVQPLDKHQSSLDVITRYYDQLCVMENKLPITPTQNPISFKWRDAFDKGSLFFSRASLTINDASFERAAVLYNCGALMSAIASSQPMHSDEELKSVAKLFQQAAGIFAKLKDTVLGLVQQEPTPDLLPDTLVAISMLMLAQAQEAIYTKAKKDEMKPSALVKISQQCGDFYQEANRLMNRDNVKGIWEKEWLNTATGKGFVFSSLAQYHQAVACGESSEIGEQLARLKEAQRLMDQASSYLPAGTSFANDSIAIKKALERASKDNDFIYRERVPDFKSLALLPKAALAKPTPINFPVSPRFRDLFESLVPVQIQNALSTFESRKADVINMETGRMREYTQLMNACLASLNLPAALDDVTNHERCPESIREKSAKVKASGGISVLQGKLKELPSLYKVNDEILNETGRLLREEKENDDRLRAEFKGKWTRVGSEQLTTPLNQEMAKYRSILQTAASADHTVTGKFQQNQQGIEILSKTENELKASIPDTAGSGQTGNKDMNSIVEKLRNLMDQVQEIKVERENVEKDLKQVRFDMSSDFLRSMSENGVVNEEKMSSEKIQELFNPLKQRVEQSLKRQEGVMAEVELWNKKFTEAKQGGGGSERESILKTLATAYDAFLELDGNLKEGTKFYNDLTPLLVRLQQKVSDFCFARQTEKDDLMKQVQMNIVSGGSSGPAFKVPPARPPPPAIPPNANNSASAAPPPPPAHHQWGAAPPYGQQQQPNPYNPYAPYGSAGGAPPQQQQPQQYYSTPYPMTYPGNYPSQPQANFYAGYPPAPQFPQQQQAPFQQPPQQNNPFM